MSDKGPNKVSIDGSAGMASEALVDFLIVTAVEVERKAVCKAFKLRDKDRVDKGTRRYWRGRLPLKNGEFYEIVVAQLSDMGNVDATALTVDAIYQWDPGAFLLVGIAGAAKEEVELGDLIIASDIYYYERGKVTSSGKRPEPKVYKTDATLWNKVITASEWKPRISTPRPDGSTKIPVIHKGVIASGEKVIAEEAAREDIASAHRKTLAIEMEGYGFSAAVFQNAPGRHHLVMKAICDRADLNKGEDWQAYAAEVAAAYTKHFLQRDRPLEPRNIRSQQANKGGEEQIEGLLRRQQRQREIKEQQQALLDNIASEVETREREPPPLYTERADAQPAQNYSAISGRQPTSEAPLAGIGLQIDSLITSLSSALSQERVKELESIRELYREGKVQEARQKIREIRQDASWQFLDSPAKALILRVMAAFDLNIEGFNLIEAKEIASEIATIAPGSDDLRITRALLRFYEEGAAAALQELGETTSVEVLNHRLFILINSYLIDDALRDLQNIPASVVPNTETRRLKALALMLGGDLGSARDEIQRVLQDRPHWEYARSVAAMVDYFTGLSPAAMPDRFIPWPQPVDWSLVKRDDRSVSLFRKAEEEFARLAEETQRGEGQRSIFEIWRLACVANDPARKDEAASLIRTLLERDPANHRTIAWARTHNFEIDIASSQKALEESISTDGDAFSPSKAEKVLTLVGLYLESGKTLEAISLLERTRGGFVDIGNESLWTYWKARVFIANGDPNGAVNLAEEENDPATKRSIKTMALRAVGIRSGDWEPLTKHLEASFEESHDGIYLLELCQLKFRFKDWGYVADRADTLIDIINTPDAVRLGAIAAWNAKHPEQCLSLIDAYHDKFSAGHLPSDLWRLQIQCQAIKDIPKALSSAQELVRRDQTTANLLVLIDAQLSAGDLRGVVVTAREVLRQDDVKPRSLLQIARIVHLEHEELAKEFWLRAKNDILGDPDLLSEAIALGFTLGLDKELGPLFARLQEFTDKGEGPFKLLDLQQVGSWMQERREYVEYINQNYVNGAIPLHFFSKAVRVTLAEILHGITKANRATMSLHRRPKVFIRHGGRPVLTDAAEVLPERRLHVDITALLVAEDLGILEKVERRFSPLYIPSTLLTALTSQRERLIPHQPSRLPIYKKTLALLEQRKIQPIAGALKAADEYKDLVKRMGEAWVSVAVEARTENGFVVDYLPLTSNDVDRIPVTLPEELARHLSNCRSIVESLKDAGWLTAPAYQRTLEALKSERGQCDQSTTPPIGAKLYLLGNILTFLIEADIIDLVCDKFSVFVDPRFIQEAQGVIQENEQRSELETWLGKLVDRLSAGLVNGTYRGLEISDEGFKNLPEDSDQDFEFMAASELLRYKPDIQDVIWCDDRFINSYISRDNIVPIVGVNEILTVLRSLGDLTEDEYYGKLLTLRAGNCRYIPIDEEEMLYHLNHAREGKGGILVETPELSILRRYIAACLLDAQSLQRPPMPEGAPNQTGEMAFVANTTHAVTAALVGLWADEDKDIEIVKACSEWLLNNIYTGLFGVIHLLPNPEVRGDGVNEAGMDIGGVLGRGLLIRSGRLALTENSRREEFFRWFDERVILPRMKADPASITTAAALIKSMLELGPDRSYDPPELEDYDRAFKNIFYNNLPSSVKDKIELRPEAYTWMGINMVEAVPIGPANFSAAGYWESAEKAVNEGTAAAPALGSTAEFTFRRVEAEGDITTLEIIDSEGKVLVRFRDPILNLLFRDVARRETVLRSHRFWFNCEQEVFEKEIREIAATEDVRTRLDRANDWRGSSAEYFYRNLQVQLSASKQFLWSDLLPRTAGSLLGHYRIDVPALGDLNFGDVLVTAANSLIAEEGLDTALNRLACLPVRIPAEVVAEFSSLPQDERHSLLEKYASEWASPVGKLQLVDLILQSESEGTQIQLAKSILADLFNEDAGGRSFEAFNTILNYMNTEFGYWVEAEAWPAPIKIAMLWAHASRIHSVFILAGADPQALARLFRPSGQPMSTDILERDPAYWNDAIHPHRLSREVFLTHGVSSILADRDPQTLEALGAVELISNYAFAEDANRKIIQLIQDPQLMVNGTGSFLSGDRAEVLSPIIGEENAGGLSSSNLEGMVRSTIEELEQNPAQKSWGTITAITKDLPIYPSLRERLKTLLAGLDIESLWKTDAIATYHALRVAASQAPYYEDEDLRNRFEEGLLLVAQSLSERYQGNVSTGETDESGISMERHANELLDISLALSARLNDPRATTKAWSQLLQNLLIRWPQIGEHIASTFSRLVYELPLRQLHGMWPVLLSLRSSRASSL